MTEVLSAADVDYLLDSIEAIGDVSRIGDPSDDENASDMVSTIAQKKIKLYDFRHPDRFSKEQLRTIEIMHETFARLVTNSLSTRLRTFVEVHVQSVSQITYEEFIKTIPNPTLFSVLDMQPLKGSAVLEINPSITFSIVERLFGGSGGAVLNRELTEIEQSVASSIVESMLGFLREAWRRIIQLRLHLLQIETNTQLAQIIPPNEMMLMIVFSCRINDVDGMINIAIPYITIESIIPKLSAHTWYTAGGIEEEPEVFDNLRKSLENVDVNITAVLGTLKLSFGEVLSLQPNDVLQLYDVKYNQPINVYVEKEKKFKAIPGRMGTKKAIRIVENLSVKAEDFLKEKSAVTQE